MLSVFIQIKTSAGDSITYAFDATELPAIQPIPIQKQDDNLLRVLSYNMLSDDLLDDARRPSFTRIIKALKPDIIGFQEIFVGKIVNTLQFGESFTPDWDETPFADLLPNGVFFYRLAVGNMVKTGKMLLMQ